MLLLLLLKKSTCNFKRGETCVVESESKSNNNNQNNNLGLGLRFRPENILSYIVHFFFCQRDQISNTILFNQRIY